MRFLFILLLLLAMQNLSPVAAQTQEPKPSLPAELGGRGKLYKTKTLDKAPAYVPRQLVVSTKTVNYPENINALRDYIRKLYADNPGKYNGIDSNISRKSCGSCGDFELWESDILQIVIDSAGGPRSGVKASIVASGISLNFITNLPKSAKLLERLGHETSITQQPYTGAPIKIAIFDTGLDTTRIKGYTQTFFDSCSASNTQGWNFALSGNNFIDNSQTKHGTVVARLLINEMEKLRPAVPGIQIIPVKVLNENGKGTLFDFLCGINYAAKAGAKIINASLGFYHYADTVEVFEAYIDSVLAENKITMFAAAGNKQFDHISFTEIAFPDSSIRDINKNYFYPGGFSVRNKNIICVTTTNKQGSAISPRQNFSDKRVNMSVAADKAYCFKHPFKKGCFWPKYIEGSSFATPVFAGKYIAWLYKTGNSLQSGRDAVLGMMRPLPVIKKTALDAYIMDGNFIAR